MSHTQFKIIIFIFMALILYNLFRGLYFLVTGKGGGKNTARSLSWRIGLSFVLFLLLMALKLTGMVEPHNLNQAPPVAASTPEPDDKKDEGKTLEEIKEQTDSSGGRIRLKP
jgi:hypothetical protein